MAGRFKPRRGPRLKQQLFWKAVARNGFTSISADTASREQIIAGTALAPAAEAPESWTFRRMLWRLSILNGAAANFIHAGVIVQSVNETVLSPRTGAGDNRWMWWASWYVPASSVIPSVSVPIATGNLIDIRVNRKMSQDEALYFVTEGTEAFDYVINVRALIGTGLTRA